MFSIFYNKYKVWFWFILSFLFGTGTISKMLTGAKWEVPLNGGLALLCLVVAIVLLSKQKANKE